MTLSRILYVRDDDHGIQSVNLEEAPYPVRAGMLAIPYDGPAQVGWTWKNDHAEPTLTLASYEAAIQDLLNSTARAWGYSAGMDRAVTYIGDPNPQWNADAVALRAWRSAVWQKSDSIMASFDPKNPPPIADVLAQLPPPPARP